MSFDPETGKENEPLEERELASGLTEDESDDGTDRTAESGQRSRRERTGMNAQSRIHEAQSQLERRVRNEIVEAVARESARPRATPTLNAPLEKLNNLRPIRRSDEDVTTPISSPPPRSAKRELTA